MGRNPLIRGLLYLLAATFAWAAGPAAAQAPDNCVSGATAAAPVEVFPSTGGTNVGLNASVRAVFPWGVLGDAEVSTNPLTTIRLERCLDAECTDTEPVAGVRSIVGDVLVFQPQPNLLPRSVYVGEATGPEGGIPLQFETGVASDVAPPFLGEFLDISTSPADDCDPSLTRRVNVTFERALDDGPAGDIEYLLYLSRAEGLEAPELRARKRNFGATTEITMALLLTKDEEASGICVNVIAIDGAGNLDDNGDTLCFDPRPGAFFEGICAVGSPDASHGGGQPLLPLVMVLFALGARRWRRWRWRSRGE